MISGVLKVDVKKVFKKRGKRLFAILFFDSNAKLTEDTEQQQKGTDA